MAIVCLNCGRPYPDAGVPHECAVCGGLFDETGPLNWQEADRARPGVWRHLPRFDEAVEGISLGEANTPLISSEVLGRRVFFKCEFSNPTGSFKDRGSAVLVSLLVSRGIRLAIEDSSGNAGASFAAYCARAGIKARVFIPEGSAGPKRQQIEMQGADLVVVPGARSAAAAAARKAADGGTAYCSHAYLPHNLAGYATCAYEIVEQLGRAPGAVLVPAGQGGLLLGLGRGFEAMRQVGVIRTVPTLIGVQAAACAPLAALFEIGVMGLNLVTEGSTVADGVRVRTPVRADAVVKMVVRTTGSLMAVEEHLILPGRDALARLGYYVEPTSALVWPPLLETLPRLRDPVVAVLTGAGYKVLM